MSSGPINTPPPIPVAPLSTMQLDKVLKVAVRGGASDIILKTGSIPKFRFNGELIPLRDGEIITPEIMRTWIKQAMPPHLTVKFETTGDADFGFQLPGGNRFRVNAYRQRQSLGMVMRVISTHIRTLEELQLPQILSDLTDEKRGLVLVTGATGSGKSTTLAAMIQKINLDRACHIVTVEDPIEFNFVDSRSTIQQREVGVDTVSFQSALRAAMRQNPDVILVGELRDKDTVETALQAADTGHLVYSTLHTLDAAESLTRILSFFPAHQHQATKLLLAHTLKAVISQRLVPRLDGKGQAAAIEVLVNSGTVKQAILTGENFDAINAAIRSGGDIYGMQSFDQSLLELYHAHVISRQECLAQATGKSDMELALQGVGA